MRNPDRIKRILNKLEIYWKEYPDTRFGQLISNITHTIVAPVGLPDLFYLEDDEFEIELDKWIKNLNDLNKL